MTDLLGFEMDIVQAGPLEGDGQFDPDGTGTDQEHVGGEHDRQCTT